ncbi:hypothetical protein [Nitrospirillum sp. BR 11828]|uniref:hypothetical protein n=1 Tax=Nitrospirillum sp. BR 11828 TaxID=3104325 RepID=UPI002ACA29AB|nr:hypothetical protein [Nitrospirillum sp. BR 11828]MDZ5650026.1 hypothetical protein [Nitrospirillum sp. BR 11828]
MDAGAEAHFGGDGEFCDPTGGEIGIGVCRDERINHILVIDIRLIILRDLHIASECLDTGIRSGAQCLINSALNINITIAELHCGELVHDSIVCQRCGARVGNTIRTRIGVIGVLTLVNTNREFVAGINQSSAHGLNDFIQFRRNAGAVSDSGLIILAPLGGL